MNYRTFGRMDRAEFAPSALGFGAMRLPLLDGSKAIDEKEAVRMMRYAVDHGVNYIDSAYFYHDGTSEVVVGKALKDGYRAKTRIATKSPVSLIEKPEDFDRILELQRKRLDTDFIDFYLLHALNLNAFIHKVQRFGLIEKMEKAKAEGKIGHIGFSFHDSGFDKFRPIVDGYDGWDFCQIQLNYLDVNNQAGVKGLKYASEKGLGVVIMEPLLGGKLANPPAAVREAMGKDQSPVELALDFLWDHPEVSLILSGMSSMTQVEQNIAFAEKARPHMLTDAQRKTVADVQRAFRSLQTIPCTKCEYCQPCPYGVEIPKVFAAFNQTFTHDRWQARMAYEQIQGKADLCQSCKRCEAVCPQKIAISDKMGEVAKAFKG